MNCLALLDVGGGQILLILALVLIFMGAKRIPEDIKGMREGMDEFRKVTRELTEAQDGEHPGSGTGHPFLMGGEAALFF